jgi:mRNA interferase MazF
MVMAEYVPEKGDLVWINFTPQSGHEQAGHRPGLILSPIEYNRKVGLAVISPITSKRKGYPFEVELPPKLGIGGVVLADQIRSLDWRARGARKAGRVPKQVLDEVRAGLAALLGID